MQKVQSRHMKTYREERATEPLQWQCSWRRVLCWRWVGVAISRYCIRFAARGSLRCCVFPSVVLLYLQSLLHEGEVLADDEMKLL